MNAASKRLTRSEWILYGASALLLMSITVAFGGSAISLILCLCALGATLANTRGLRLCYCLYFAQAALYGFVALRNRFYGEAAINLLYAAPMYIRAIWLFRSRAAHKPISEIRTLSAKPYLFFALGAAAFIPAYGWALSLLGTALPYANAASACVYIAVTYLVAKRYIEQWMFWNVYTLIQFGMWISTFASGFDNIPIVVSNLIYIVLNTVAFVRWRRFARA